MKKILCVLSLALLFSGVSMAQEENVESKGNFTFDLNFDPAAIFDAGAGDMFTMPYIKARYFTSSDFAIRIGVGLIFGGSTVYDDTDGDEYVRDMYFGTTLAPGIEKHFGGDKFFVYLGGELPITVYNERRKIKTNDDTYIYKNLKGNGYLGVGLNFIIGADYYIFNNFYIGAELAPGIAFKKYLDIKDDDDEVTTKGGREVDFALQASSGLRIGFRF